MKKDGRKYVALVTGATGGLGTAMVKHMVDDGYLCIANYHTKSKAERWNEEMKKEGYDVPLYHADVSDFESVGKMIEKIQNDIGTVDMLVNNAGITRDASMKKMTEDQWNQVIGVNLTGVYHCTKAVSPYLVDQGYGRILNASSVVGLYGNFGQTNYVASKAGVIGMTKVWAREFGRKGVTVNAVAPGFINTEMMETVPQTYLDELKSKTPMARMGEAVDIANAYAFLASDEASFITGTVLSVDGGLIL